jgi:hypothetical protein
MIRIAITEAAFAAICSTLPQGGSGEAERSVSGNRLVWIEKAIHGQLEAMRQPGEGHSETSLRLFAVDKAKPASPQERLRRPRRPRRKGSSMPRGQSYTLSDLLEPTLVVVCEQCSRRGRYSVARLIEKHGDARLATLLDTLTGCPKAGGKNIRDLCKAMYGQPNTLNQLALYSFAG